MPGFDGTGPCGYGPLTGRGFGPCRAGRFGFNGRFGRGFGWGEPMRRFRSGVHPVPPYGYPYRDPRYSEAPSSEEEKMYLEEQLQYLEKDMEEIKARLDALSKEE